MFDNIVYRHFFKLYTQALYTHGHNAYACAHVLLDLSWVAQELALNGGRYCQQCRFAPIKYEVACWSLTCVCACAHGRGPSQQALGILSWP